VKTAVVLLVASGSAPTFQSLVKIPALSQSIAYK
jgi:hypothetical protein